MREFPSIPLLQNLIVTLKHFASLPEDNPAYRPLCIMTFMAKVKAHGSNCGAKRPKTIPSQGPYLIPQSRTKELSLQDDFKGFAKYIENRNGQEANFLTFLPQGSTLFGEWAGPGVENGMAISQVPEKIWLIFAEMDSDGWLEWDPNFLKLNYPECLVLPYVKDSEITINFASEESINAAVEKINRMVAAVEKEDPWVKEIYGISGLGEGLVFYPVSWPTEYELPIAQEYIFKAKGDKHRTAGQKPAQATPTASANAQAFATNVVTEARLQQGLSAISGHDLKKTGQFINWIIADVQKETQADLVASNLTWPEVLSEIKKIARDWFLHT